MSESLARLLECGREIQALLGPDSRLDLLEEALERRARLLDEARGALDGAAPELLEEIRVQDAELVQQATMRRDQAREQLRWSTSPKVQPGDQPAKAVDFRA